MWKEKQNPISLRRGQQYPETFCQGSRHSKKISGIVSNHTLQAAIYFCSSTTSLCALCHAIPSPKPQISLLTLVEILPT